MADDGGVEHSYSSHRAKKVQIRHMELQSVCEREKKLLEFEWQTSSSKLQKEQAMFRKRAEQLYKHIQDMEIDPSNKRVNLAIQLKTKALKQSRLALENRASTAIKSAVNRESPMSRHLGDVTNVNGRPFTSMENFNDSARKFHVQEPPRSQTSLDEASRKTPELVRRSAKELKSRSVSSMDNMHPSNGLPSVPFQHPLLRKRKKDLFTRPPPKKWLEARWKAVLERNEKEKKQLVALIEEFIREIEEYKERFRKECEWKYLIKDEGTDPEEVKQTTLNRSVSIRGPIVLAGPRPVTNTEREPHQKTPSQNREKIQAVNTLNIPQIQVTDTTIIPLEPETEQVSSMTAAEKGQLAIPPLQLPQVRTNSAAQKRTLRSARKMQQQIRAQSPRLRDRGLSPTQDTNLPKVFMSKKSSLAGNMNEERFASLLDSESDTNSGDEEVAVITGQTKSGRKSDLSADTEMLMGAWQEFTHNQSLANMKKLTALAGRLKSKVSTVRDKSVTFNDTQKALKSLLIQAKDTLE